MHLKEEAPDRKYWTEYDYFEFERQQRAERRAEAYAMARKLWRRVLASVTRAGAQPLRQARAQ